jgi:protocatechuate 3,4-dioxygenase beta subunit
MAEKIVTKQPIIAPDTGRRAVLKALSGVGIGLLGTGFGLSVPAEATTESASVCVLTPEISEGPFYFPVERVRSDVTEGKPGTPLNLTFMVLNISNCRPIEGASIDFWQADASGIYSGYTSAGPTGFRLLPPGPDGPPHEDPVNKETFLRGVAYTDARGMASFRTIYPGWYGRRAVHVHVKVHVDGKVIHTGQIFFPDAITDKVFLTSPYIAHQGKRTLNTDDILYLRQNGQRSMLNLSPEGDGFKGGAFLALRSI